MPFSAEETQELITRYRSGEKVSAIVQDLAMSASTAYRLLKEHGETRSRSATALPELIVDYQAHVPFDELERRYGISGSTIRKQLRRAGVDVDLRGSQPPPGRRNRIGAEAEELILESYGSGSGTRQIAEQAGVSVGVIYRVLRRHGLEPNRTGLQDWNEQVIEMYLAGESRADIEAVTGVPSGSQYLHLKRAGVSPNRQGPRV